LESAEAAKSRNRPPQNQTGRRMLPNSSTTQSTGLFNRPYLLLSLASFFWALNFVLGRYVAGHVPPVALSFVRWTGAFLIVLPFAWPKLKSDWSAIRDRLAFMLLVSLTGIATYNTLAYYGLQYTEALNALLIQSAAPLFVALWAFLLLGVRLTWAQAAGIAISLTGVLVILTRGDPEALSSIRFNRGDIVLTGALLIFALYATLTSRRPNIHPLSFLAFTTGCGALMLIPPLGIEITSGYTLKADLETILMLVYVVIFPSTLAYLFYNRGVELIGPNRSAPFFHLMPVFGSLMAIAFLGERLQLFHGVGYALVLCGVFIAARKSSASE
jgi:drug/metabolite transporter (DMT)-like permease